MKKINFKKIIIKNFLSIGEEPVIVEFDKGLHIITGDNKDKPERRNAVGKSSVAESIYFAIFGETLRGIKKELICNNITGGKTHVELDLEIVTPNSTKQYKIIRTLSPTKVSLFEDGIDKTHDTVNNTTSYICDTLSATPAIFKNCVIMTVNNATPFMAKNKTEKRKFIEDIFGLEVFSNMISSVRNEYNDLKRAYDISNNSLLEIEKTFNEYNNQRNIILKNRKEKKELYLSRKKNNAQEIKTTQEEINVIPIHDTTQLLEDINKYEDEIEKCEKDITSITLAIAANKHKMNDLKESFQSIGTEKDTCPICLREIKDHDQNLIRQEKKKIKQDIENIGAQTKILIKNLEDLKNLKKEIKLNINKYNDDINTNKINEREKKNLNDRLLQLQNWMKELEDDITAVSDTKTPLDNIISENKIRLDESTVEVATIKEKISKLDIVKYIISEEGVKSYIVNKLIELLNSRLFYYLQKLDSNVVCLFNEYFEEEILNEKNKVCSYFNFSGAETKAIDLACLFTFSDLRRMQGGIQYNIAIYDELFDSSFDEKGIELITSILRERVEDLDECGIVISHRKESVKAATGDIIFLVKENGITRRINFDEE